MNDIFHPNNSLLISQRTELLTKTLRPDPLPFSIDDEYPIVLHDPRFSFCTQNEGNMVTHANLWPRQMLDGSGLVEEVALVGNVATEPKYQGQGHIRSLLENLSSEARKLGIAALILWSDQDLLYQKLGFQAFGQEHRFHFTLKTLIRNGITCEDIALVSPDELSDDDLAHMLTLRLEPPGNLIRSVQEFRQLLGIPALDILVYRPDTSIEAYGLCGKGYDMIGVLHEWGVQNPAILPRLALASLRLCEIKESILLSPLQISPEISKILMNCGMKQTIHRMAFIKYLGNRHWDWSNQAFIWGLDSI